MRCRIDRYAVALVWFTWALGGQHTVSVAGAAPRTAEILPEGTVLLVESPNVPELKERFGQTAWGRLLEDRQVRPLVEHVMANLGARWTANVQETVAVSWTEFLGLPLGQLALAVVVPEDGPPAVVVVCDAGPRPEALERLLQRVGERMVGQGGGQVEEQVGPIRVRRFDRLGSRQQRMGFFLHNGLGVVATDPTVITAIAATMAGQPRPVLAASDRYAAAMRSCTVGGGPAVLTAYADPVGLLRGMGRANAGLQLALALLPVLGLNGIEAAGAQLAFDAGQYDHLLQAHLLLSPQRSGALEILGLRPVDADPEEWVPVDAASYTTLGWRFEASLQALARVFDSFRGEGAMAGLIKSRLTDALGIDVDLILPALEGRVSLLSWAEPGRSPMEPRRLAGFRVKDAVRVRQALEKVVQQQPGRYGVQSYQGETYWEVAGGTAPSPSSAAPAAPAGGRACFGLLGDYLLVGDHPAVYQKAISTRQQRGGGLGQALEYKLVASRAARLSAAKPSVSGFDRPDETLRWIHSRLSDDTQRERLRDTSNRNPLLQALGEALAANPLPPFAALERYFAPGGWRVTDDASGLHYTAFGLRRSTAP